MVESLMHRKYIQKNYQEKTDSGSALCIMQKLIKYIIYIVTATTDKTFLVSVVDPSYYKKLTLY